MQGQCMCGKVKYKVTGVVPGIYQCHCSQCRKITGSSSNSSCIIRDAAFEWIEGELNITTYSDVSGYRSDFCKFCGSPVPNKFKKSSLYWVPAGSLEDSSNLKVVAYICTASKAEWGEIPRGGVQFESIPELKELLKLVLSRK